MSSTPVALVRRLTAALALGACSLTPALAAADSGGAPSPDALADKLVVDGRPMPVQSVGSTPMAGIYEVQLDSGETFYTDRSGEYLLVGSLYHNNGKRLVNLTEQAQNQQRHEAVSAIPDSETVVFRPAGEVRAVLTVFTDTTCPYCQKLHHEVPELNRRGIEVRYLAFPRAGLQGEGARELRRVWCSDNRSEAFTAAIDGDTGQGSASCDSPVAKQYRLGQQLGIQGTPAIIFPDGRMVPGYLPVDRLIGMIDQQQQADADNG
ncbi:thiol:disulfide interchange protein DsbC [Kushneria sinocarnis]|uniref:Thiol:disulfide interchange protein n=1 Tax=Kushneria sinocarnis TaxID=595502 RepID=A0A420WXP7_9GAMM|nr:DsbC family protein [Kushneria sinocarnis]RKR04515.1 thiol:disulfide interchange protein DsbC [Kushneria sinocarnis]